MKCQYLHTGAVLLGGLLAGTTALAQPITPDLAPPELTTHMPSALTSNAARIDQYGFAHWAAIHQAGTGNQGLIMQSGRAHHAGIEQVGNGNLASILQYGLISQHAGIQQLGDDNRARIEQHIGTRTSIDVLQRGDEMQVDITVRR